MANMWSSIAQVRKTIAKRQSEPYPPPEEYVVRDIDTVFPKEVESHEATTTSSDPGRIYLFSSGQVLLDMILL